MSMKLEWDDEKNINDYHGTISMQMSSNSSTGLFIEPRGGTEWKEGIWKREDDRDLYCLSGIDFGIATSNDIEKLKRIGDRVWEAIQTIIEEEGRGNI